MIRSTTIFLAVTLIATSLWAEPIAVFVSVQEGEDAPTFWWSADAPALSLFDQEMLAQDRVTVSYPKSLSVSRIFKVADLSTNNARTLASNFGVKRGVVGTLVIRPVDPIAGMSGFVGELSVASLTSTDAFTLRRVSFNDDPLIAKKRLMSDIAQTLAVTLRSSLHSARAEVGLVRQNHEAHLETTGDALLRLLAELRKNKVDARLLWASGGRVSFGFPNEPAVVLQQLKDVSVIASDQTPNLFRVE